MKICCPNCNHEFIQINPKGNNLHKKATIVQTLVIVNLCANHFNVTYAQVVGRSREKQIVKARHSAIYLLYKWGFLTCKEIGQLINRDHTTVVFGKQRVLDSFSTKTDLYEDILFLESEVEAYLNPSKQLKATA